MNITHDPSVESWIESANDPETDFPLQNLPFGIFRKKVSKEKGRVGVALGDRVVNLAAVHKIAPFEGDAKPGAATLLDDSLNNLMACGPECWSAVRRHLFELFRKGSDPLQNRLQKCLVLMEDTEMLLPVRVGDYTDFYASIFHATNVGTMLRPDNPLLPNYKYVPIAYHGRSSSIVVSGTAVRRPSGQTLDDDKPMPSFGPSRLLDYELEVGVFVGPGNEQGKEIPIDSAPRHIFGLCLLNDWSARDIQKWEYQPLGPFLSKNFATTISPWIVTLEALEPFRVTAFSREPGDPEPLPYLRSSVDRTTGGINIALEVFLASRLMREKGLAPALLSKSNFSDLYWTVAQMLTHHASNGCNMRPGDLLGSGTVSGRGKNSRGCLLELTWRGKDPITLPSGELRKFLEDGDEVILRGTAQREKTRRIGFGFCSGIILTASGGST